MQDVECPTGVDLDVPNGHQPSFGIPTVDDVWTNPFADAVVNLLLTPDENFFVFLVSDVGGSWYRM